MEICNWDDLGIEICYEHDKARLSILEVRVGETLAREATTQGEVNGI